MHSRLNFCTALSQGEWHRANTQRGVQNILRHALHSSRMADNVKFAFAWVKENDLSCKSSIGRVVVDHMNGKYAANNNQDSDLISRQLRNALTAIALAVTDHLSLVKESKSHKSECLNMMAFSRLSASAVLCLLAELPMAIFDRDSKYAAGMRRVPPDRIAPISNCSATTVAGRFVSSMMSTLFLLHQRVIIDLHQLDDVAKKAADKSGIIILSSFAPSSSYRFDDPNALFPLNLQQSARYHSVDGLLFYTYGNYIRPPAYLTPLYLENVFEWNCLQYSPFARDSDSFCRSLMASELDKRGFSV